MSQPDLVAVAVFVAADLDQRAYPFAGAVRQVARRLAELELEVQAAAETVQRLDNCEHCGEAITQPEAGHPRRFCSDRCRRAAWRTKERRMSQSMAR